jgi:hypothetical protein
MCSDIIPTKVLGRKTYRHIYAKKQPKCNRPESGPEAITWIEILFIKSVMHVHPCIMMPGHTRHLLPEWWILPVIEYIVLNLTKRKFEISEIIDFQETIVTAILWKRVFPRIWHKKYYATNPVCKGSHKHTYTHKHTCTEAHKQIHTHTHTHTHTHFRCSFNSKHIGVSEFLDVYVIKVPFSSNNP